MRGYGGGNPWQAAANAYGSDLDQYNQIAMQGMNERANAPYRLYQAFMQSYQAAQDRQMQEEDARRADEFQRQKLAIEQQRWDQQNEQAKAKETAAIQTLIARSYRPELRDSLKAQLRAINPNIDEAKIDEMLPRLTPEKIPTFSVPGGEELPLMPSDPKFGLGVLPGGSVQDTFRGLDVVKEENDKAQAEANLKRQYDIQAAQARSAQELALVKSDLAIELQKLRGSQGLQQLQVKIDAGAYAPRGSAAIDTVDPGNAAAIDALARRAIDTGDLSGLGMGNNPLKAAVVKRMGERINASGGETPSLAGNKANWQADAKSLKDLQAMSDNINAFERTAIGNWGRFQKAIEDLGNTNSPALNRPINWLRSNAAGDPKVSAAIAAGQAAHTEFARLINNPRLVGILTDSAREEVFRSLPKSFEDATPAQIHHVGEILKADAAQRKNDLSYQIAEIKNRMGSNGRAATPGKAGGKAADGFDLTWEGKTLNDTPKNREWLKRQRGEL